PPTGHMVISARSKSPLGPWENPVASTYQISDSFSGSELDPKWYFFGNYDKKRFQIKNNSLQLKAKGNGIADSYPLLISPSDHSYSVSVEMTIKGNAIGGLVLFYNEKSGSGILADQKNI